MPTITITDLSNAKLDVDHISEFATTAAPTVTDRLGNVKPSIAGLSAEYPNASVNASAAAADALASEASRQASGVSAGLAATAKTGAEAARDAAAISALQLDNYTATPTVLATAMADVLLPMPSFVEGWALNSFMGVATTGTPTNTGLPLDAMNMPFMEYTVSGAAGASTMTITAGDLTKFVAGMGCVAMHNDGTYGLYTITNLAGSDFTVFPNVRSVITSQVLRNFGGSNLGQHLAENGYKALARKVFSTSRGSAYRLKYAAKWDASSGDVTDWTPVGGLSYGQSAIAISNNYIAYSAVRSMGSFMMRGRRYLTGGPSAAPYIGKGFTKTFALGGSTGFLEAFVSCAKIANSAGGGFYAFNVKVVVDAVTLLDAAYTENAGLQRVVVPYTAGTSGTITVTFGDNASPFGCNINVGDVTWWKYDRTPQGYNWADPVIDKNVKTVVIGDSWTTYYPSTPGSNNGVFGRELQAAMTAAGGTGVVKSVGLGGTTAENYGLPNFDTLVMPEAPLQVVIMFFTNDHASYGDYNYGRWLSAMYKIGRKCQAIGARPIYVMPLPTQSIGQSIGHGIWADEFGAGLPG